MIEIKFEVDESGDLIVDPVVLSARLSLDTEDLRRRMRIGLVTSLIEVGIGTDEGRRRVTVRCGDKAWRAVIDARQVVLSEDVFDLRHEAAGAP